MVLSPIKSGTLLRPPMEVTSTSTSAKMTRSEVKFNRMKPDSFSRTESEKFRLPVKRDFNRQFAHIYRHRLEVMKAMIEREVKAKSGLTPCPLAQLDSASSDKDQVVIGTVFKNQSLKPNILQEIGEENGLLPQPFNKTKYISDDDELILEEELQRIKLRGEVNVGKLVTGVVAGFLGREKEKGKFFVKEIFYASRPVQPERIIPSKDRYVAFLSGLELATRSSRFLGALQMAVDWIGGEDGEMEDQERNGNIERVIIAGNSLCEDSRGRDEINKAKYLTRNNEAGSIEAVNLLDSFLVQLAGFVGTDIMPGEFDPANMILPQQPLHPCLFPKASAYSKTLSTVSNPYEFELNGSHVLGFSGQNVDDILRNTDLESPLDAMESILTWSHMAPTCPDTLGCFPFRDQDPFIMNKTPHVMFAGNQKEFGQRTFESNGQKVKLISIPKFSESPSVVLLNLRTLEAEEIQFENNFILE